MSKNKTILLVHPFTSEKVLYARIKERGYRIITLVTDFDKNWIQQCMPVIEQHSDVILKVKGDYEADISSIEQAIKQHQLDVVAVLNCFDNSIYYSDCLANHLLNLNIDTQYSQKRIDKFEVNDALAKAGVRHIKSVLIGSLADLNRREISELGFPLIIKPASGSAARVDVVIVHDQAELNSEVKRLFDKASMFHEKKHSRLLLQQYIQGEEYLVNAATMNGEHYTGGILKYRKQGKKFFGIFSLDESYKKEADTLEAFDKQCLDALKVTYGITHNEYILTKDNVPYLIEINNRLGGVEIPYLSQICYHSDEVTAFLDALEGNPVQAFDCEKIYAYSAIPYLSNYSTENAKSVNIAGLQSDTQAIMSIRPGIVDASGESTDMFIKVSTVLTMHHQNKKILEQDIDTLFKREKEGTLFLS